MHEILAGHDQSICSSISRAVFKLRTQIQDRILIVFFPIFAKSIRTQSPEDCAISIANIIRHHETEYLTSLQASYSNLPDTTFKDLRRKLPVTRTLFPWHNTMQFSLSRDISKELGIGK
ncbi:F-actin-capping protein subunit alpha [Vitis vinifera]|uniref:F-actin-capping protein subunit alpha n=1 Tax=Vitis vinifera TaxID=29760 RepID=A0A438HFA7_VITVI|nr:F-actin-capping protein subunit alpha [Vitis vinifera]